MLLNVLDACSMQAVILDARPHVACVTLSTRLLELQPLPPKPTPRQLTFQPYPASQRSGQAASNHSITQPQPLQLRIQPGAMLDPAKRQTIFSSAGLARCYYGQQARGLLSDPRASVASLTGRVMQGVVMSVHGQHAFIALKGVFGPLAYLGRMQAAPMGMAAPGDLRAALRPGHHVAVSF